MKAIDVYKTWAPKDSIWSPWVRPVSFLNIENANAYYHGLVPQMTNADKVDVKTAVFLDLPGTESVLQGLAYAKEGFQPVALFNATPAQKNARALVDTKSITNLLYWGASYLKDFQLKPDARPVFLLDSTRLLRYRVSTSIYDNSWDLYDQDIPSAEFFFQQNIDKILVIGEKINRDLARIFYKFQQKGMIILWSDGLCDAKVMILKKPPKKDKFH